MTLRNIDFLSVCDVIDKYEYREIRGPERGTKIRQMK